MGQEWVSLQLPKQNGKKWTFISDQIAASHTGSDHLKTEKAAIKEWVKERDKKNNQCLQTNIAFNVNQCYKA